jgi:S-adenosylmethionine synthetase
MSSEMRIRSGSTNWNEVSRLHSPLLVIDELSGHPDQGSFEVVERKGIGHPDTLCDAIAEAASIDYSRYCVRHFGRTPHHWFDKVMLIGGAAELNYGVGRLTAPYRIIFAGKAALSIGRTRSRWTHFFAARPKTF